ncbi:MAG TPA: type IV pilus twitching motility protein PilT [bacterium]|nr:type IV pilus twitching motility protein PilT [bacterium]
MITRDQINNLLTQSFKGNASDIHLSEGYPPIVRIDGKLQQIKGKVLSKQDLEDVLVQILDDYQMERFQKDLELDFGYAVEGVAHFRTNVFNKLGGYGIAFRAIPEQIRSLKELMMPQGVINLARRHEGLVLVTGPTGHGKSTTLAAMIDLMNEERQSHIITIEDPIEYKHKKKNCLIQQRELGHHTHSFSAALRSALREDPDIILVGEMRDLETISLALTAAETGHLVLSTLHTRNAPDTINRIIDVFPSTQQGQVLAQISSSLIGVISQRLLPTTGGDGRVAAMEVLIANSAIRNMIRERKIHQILSTMQSATSEGMIPLDDHLFQLLRTGKIDRATAMKYANDPDRFFSKPAASRS